MRPIMSLFSPDVHLQAQYVVSDGMMGMMDLWWRSLNQN